ncbi:centromere protein O [Amblyraja radiata]|uniref:centromere protein O n=1 Tax=Amblyraja radiata TaxID=386614 RepID=UPI001403094A|nr:centromere protein O [Amblyraja radiata]
MAGNSSNGVLERLRQLEGSVEQGVAEQERAERSHGRLQQLQATVRQLRAARDRLRSAVSTGAAGDMQELLVQLGSGSVRRPGQEELAAAVLREKLAPLQGFAQVYRLTGISSELRDSSTMSVCIHTAYDGTYLDSYQLDMRLQQPRKLLRHNLPACIPLQQSAGELLQRDLPAFLEAVHGMLNAYVSRRYQLQQMQEHYDWTSQIRKNTAYNLLRFHYSVEDGETDKDIRVKLVYEDLNSCLPTGVTITCTGAAEEGLQEKLERHRQLLLSQHLHRALESIKDQDTLL